MKPMTATDCADRISLLDYRLFRNQQWMPAGQLKEMVSISILKKRASLVRHLAKLNAEIRPNAVVSRLTVKELLYINPLTYQEWSDGKDDTAMSSNLVRQFAELSGHDPGMIHSILLGINPIVDCQNDHDNQVIQIYLRASLREVVHALGGVMEGEEEAASENE